MRINRVITNLVATTSVAVGVIGIGSCAANHQVASRVADNGASATFTTVFDARYFDGDTMRFQESVELPALAFTGDFHDINVKTFRAEYSGRIDASAEMTVQTICAAKTYDHKREIKINDRVTECGGEIQLSRGPNPVSVSIKSASVWHFEYLIGFRNVADERRTITKTQPLIERLMTSDTQVLLVQSRYNSPADPRLQLRLSSSKLTKPTVVVVNCPALLHLVSRFENANLRGIIISDDGGNGPKAITVDHQVPVFRVLGLEREDDLDRLNAQIHQLTGRYIDKVSYNEKSMTGAIDLEN